MATVEIVTGVSSSVYGYNPTYATARSDAYSYLAGAAIYVGQLSGAQYACYRLFYRFDTSIIGAGQTVSQVNLKLTASPDRSDTDFDVEVVKCNWGPYDPITGLNAESAYDLALSSSADNNIWRNTSGMSINTTYTSGNLDTSWVNMEGYTYYALRSGRDASATQPSGNEYIGLYHNTSTPTSYRPTLVVTYTEGGGGSSTPIHLIRTGMQPGMRIGL